MQINERIASRRKELDLSADQVAEALGVSRSTVYRYESSDIEKLPANMIEPLAIILKTTPAYLMGWDETLPSAPEPEIKLDDIGYALYGETRELDDNDKQELLRMAQRMRELQELKKKHNK